MNSLPSDLLGKLFTYLPRKEAAKFQLLNRKCGCVIAQYGIYFKKPYILLNISPSSEEKLAFEIFIRCSTSLQKNTTESLIRPYEKDSVASFDFCLDGRIVHKVDTSTKCLPESGRDQFESLQSIVRWISWNCTVLHSKWGKRSATVPAIQELTFGGYFHPGFTKFKRKLIDVLQCEECHIDQLNFTVPIRRSTILEHLLQFPLAMHRNNSVNKVVLSSGAYLIQVEYLIPLVSEWTHGITIDIGNQWSDEFLDSINKLKEVWNARRNQRDYKPWTVTVQFGVFIDVGTLDSNIETFFLSFVDEHFSVSLNMDGYTGDWDIKKYTAKIKAN